MHEERKNTTSNRKNERQTDWVEMWKERVTSDMAGEVWFVPAPVSESVLLYRIILVGIGGSDS